jgi:hypothetical protein
LYIPVGVTIYKIFDRLRNSKQIRKVLGQKKQDLSDDEQSEGSIEARRGANANNISSLQNALDISACKSKNVIRRRVRRNFTSMFITIVVCYVISYLPTFALKHLETKNPLKFWLGLDDVSLNILMISGNSHIINPMLNPYIYGYFDLTFRRQFIQSVSICK